MSDSTPKPTASKCPTGEVKLTADKPKFAQGKLSVTPKITNDTGETIFVEYAALSAALPSASPGIAIRRIERAIRSKTAVSIDPLEIDIGRRLPTQVSLKTPSDFDKAELSQKCDPKGTSDITVPLSVFATPTPRATTRPTARATARPTSTPAPNPTPTPEVPSLPTPA